MPTYIRPAKVVITEGGAGGWLWLVPVAAAVVAVTVVVTWVAAHARAIEWTLGGVAVAAMGAIIALAHAAGRKRGPMPEPPGTAERAAGTGSAARQPTWLS